MRRSSRLQEKHDTNEQLARAKRDARAISPERSHDKVPHKKQKTGKLESLGSTQDTSGQGPKHNRVVRKKQKRGFPAFAITDTPLDILFEIFSHLDLKAIWALTRTCKDFRSLLLHHSISGIGSIWVNARERVEGIPSKPYEFSEPYFASLMFDTLCMKCHKVKGSIFLYGSRVCKGCIGRLSNRRGVPPLHRVAGSLRSMNVEPDVEKLLHEAQLLYGHHGYRVQDSQEMLDEYLQIVHKGTKAKGVAWLSKQCRCNRVKQKFIDRCNDWIVLQQQDRRHELAAIRNKRYSDILARLRHLGFDNINNRQQMTLRDMPAVRIAQPLTEASWTSIESTVVNLAEGFQRDSIASDHETRYGIFSMEFKKYRKSLPVSLRAIDVVEMQPFKDVMEKDVGYFRFSEASLAEAWNQLPRLVEEWQQSANERLFSIASRIDPSIQRISDIKLATKLFHCPHSASQTVTMYPFILQHNCRFESWLLPDATVSETILRATPWNKCDFEFRHSEHAERLLTSCGLDPSSTTHEEVLTRSPAFECISCSEASQEAPHEIRAFYSAICHMELEPEHNLRYIDHAQLAAWKLSHSDVYGPQDPPYTDSWKCKRCDDDSSIPGYCITLHLKFYPHHIENPQMNVDYVRDWGKDLVPNEMKALKVN